MTLKILTNILGILVLLILSIQIGTKKRFDFLTVVRIAGLISLCAFLTSIGMFHLQTNLAASETLFLVSLLTASWSLFLLSAVDFRKAYRRALKKWSPYLIGLTGVIAYFIISSVFFDLELLTYVEMEKYGRLIIFSDAGKYFLVFLILNLVLSIYNFEAVFHTVRKQNTTSAFWLVFLPFSGLLLFALYGLSYALLYSRISLSFLSWGSGVVLVTVLITIMVLFKQKIDENNIRINREVVYSSGIFIYIGLYFILISLISKLLSMFHISLNTFFSVLAAIVVVIGFFAILMSNTLKKRFKNFIDRTIYRGKIDYQQLWHEFSENISSILDIHELIDAISKTIKNKINVSRLRFYISENNGGNTYACLQGSEKSSIMIDEYTKDWLTRYGKAFSLISEGSPEQQKLVSQFIPHTGDQHANLIVSPLISKRELVGVLVCERNHGKTLSYQESDLLNTLSMETATAISSLQLSQELIEAREIESFHRLSTFIVHDIKNLISQLNLVVENAEEHIRDPDFQQDMLETISDSVNQMTHLINKIRLSTREQALDYQHVDIEQLIQRVLQALNIEQHRAITFENRMVKDAPRLLADRDKLYKVVFNFVLNAMEAMPEGGKLTITTSFDERIYQIAIEDTGVGMSQAFIDQKLFHPFATTKKKGLGIGLYQSKEIIKAHGGSVTVDSTVDQGTTFTIVLPLRQEEIKEPNHENKMVESEALS